MADFSRVVIIYNPKSTGDSQANAEKLQAELHKALPRLPVKCIPTKYAGHAEKLAQSLARARERVLVVSSSGDGGYHEVINGVMQADPKGKSTVCAVLPAGNANDHSRTMQDKPLWEAIKQGKVTHIDLLQITINSGGKQHVRYAHSYAGLGLTPVIATELNRYTLNAFKETSLVIKTFFKYRPFKIRRDNKTFTFDSLIFANINQMAKILTLAPKNKPDDGKFEIVSFPHARKYLLIKKLFKAATVGLKTNHREHRYSFEVLKNMPMQMDGEVTNLMAGSHVEIAAAAKALPTII